MFGKQFIIGVILFLINKELLNFLKIEQISNLTQESQNKLVRKIFFL